MKKRNLVLILFVSLLMASCSQNNKLDQTSVSEEKSTSSFINHESQITNSRSKDNITENNNSKSDTEIIMSVHKNNINNKPTINKEKNNDKSSDNVDDPTDNIIKDEKPIIKDNPKPPKENIKPDNRTEQAPPIKEEPIVTPPKEEPVKKLCENAWYDEFKDCDYIPDNLKPVDELGRSVPLFNTSQEAWNWGENEIENNKSGYGCRGFTRMDGHYNNGKQFFFAYLKVCDN